MTKQVVNLGTSANSNNGDPLRTAFTKINSNFDELYVLIGAGTGNITDVTAPAFNHNRHNNVTVTVDSATDQIILDAQLSSVIKDITGSVFADDSTLLVDGVNGKIPSANLQGTEVNNWNTAYSWGDHSQAGYLTTPLQININGDDSATTVIGNNGTIQFKGDANITSVTDQSGTITYTLNSEISADLTGSVFADDSTILINGTNGTIQADHLVGTLPAIDGSNLTSVPAQSFASLTSKPTTLAGYGITDATSNASPAFTGAVDFTGTTSVDFTGATVTGLPAAYSDSDVDTHLNTGSAGSNEVLSWTGSDYDWVAQSGGGGDVVSDTTPQLGGNLDVNGNSIVSVSDGDINFAPDGAGEVTVTGNATISNVAKAYEMIVTSSNAALKLGDGTGSEGYMNIYLNNVSGGAKHIIQSYPTAGGGFKIQNLVNDQAITFETKNSSGTTKTPLILNGDGSVAVTGVEEKFATTNGATGVTALDCSTGHVHYLTAPAGDITANFTNLDLTAEYATNVTVIIDQGGTEYEITAVQIGGVAQTIVWQGNSAPTGTANGVDSFSFTILNDGGTYVVLGQMVAFGGV